jgi:hypothetical protein
MRRALLVVVIACTAPGCVLRTLEVKSTPAGATVYLDDQAVGETPLTMGFDFYGTRAIRVAKEGYHPHQGEVELSAPWYEWFPLDFISEILWPGTIRDRHDVAVELRKIEPGPIDAAATTEFAARAQRRLLESRVQGYVRSIAMELESLDATLGDDPAPEARRTAIGRRDRLREALTALPHAGSVADLAVWEAAHRAAVLGE